MTKNNHIPENIKYLLDIEDISMDEFGQKFDVNRGMISQYARGGSVPKLHTIQKICAYFNIGIDDFVNSKIKQINKNTTRNPETIPVNEKKMIQPEINFKYVTVMEQLILDKEKIIKSLEQTIQDKVVLIKSITEKCHMGDQSIEQE